MTEALTADAGRRAPWRVGYAALLGYAASAPFSILVSELCLVVVFFALVALCRQIPTVIRESGMTWFVAGILGYSFLSILAAIFSTSPAESLVDCKSLLLLLLPLAAVLIIDSLRRWWVFLSVLAVSSGIAALFGIYQYLFVLGAGGVSTRAHGFFSIYMTYGQFMMLVGAFAFAVLLERAALRNRIIAAALWAAATVAMGFSFVRGAWVGMVAAAGAVFGSRGWRHLLALPIALLWVVALAPPDIFSRMMSIASLSDESNRDRIDLIRSGALMIRDNPFLGVGPNMVSRSYLLYMMPGAFPRISPHLHNNFVQIAAERGLPALGCWLLMLVVYFCAVWLQVLPSQRGHEARALALGSFAAVISFLVSGLFDYNFGDSEVAMLFLAALAIPFSLRRLSRPPRP